MGTWCCCRWSRFPRTSFLALQGRLEQLLPELWAKILQQLSTQDLLRARQVSKHFVCLTSLLRLDMSWYSHPEAKGGSLALFVRRNCLSATSPHVCVRIWSEVWPCIMLAAECSNLLKLDCTHNFLSPSEAAACLRLLPSTLESLRLDTTLDLIPDLDLQRMQHLTCLSLSGSRVGEDNPVLSPAGLQALRSVQVFQVTNKSDTGIGSLDAATFAHSSLTRLELAENLFREKVDLAGLPALHTISIFHHMQLPGWLLEQPFPRLEMWDVDQFEDRDVSKLLCNQLMFVCGEDDPAWAISIFLEMPKLQQLEAVSNYHFNHEPAPLKMHGSHASYQALLQRVSLRLEYPFELQLSSPVATMPLRKSGHALVCICSACLCDASQPVHN